MSIIPANPGFAVIFYHFNDEGIYCEEVPEAIIAWQITDNEPLPITVQGIDLDADFYITDPAYRCVFYDRKADRTTKAHSTTEMREFLVRLEDARRLAADDAQADAHFAEEAAKK
jgi:hypothetical protein